MPYIVFATTILLVGLILSLLYLQKNIKMFKSGRIYTCWGICYYAFLYICKIKL